MKKRKIFRLLAVICLVSALVVVGYPYMNQYMYDKEVNGQMDAFIASISAASQQASAGGQPGELLLDELYEYLRQENIRIFNEGQKDLKDPFSYEHSPIDLTRYGIHDGIIGYVSVPSMNISLPIYLGANEANMKLGAAHLTQTSYPIGGENTNTVIAAHRGYSKAAMFRDIEQVQMGDFIYLHTIKGTLTYRVTQLEVILPTEVNKVLIQDGKEMLTLFTCHPYRQNKQRYVVYCERLD